MLVPCFRPVSHGRIKTTRPVSWDVVQRGGGTGDVGGVCWCIGACLVGAIGRVRGDWSWKANPAHFVPFFWPRTSQPRPTSGLNMCLLCTLVEIFCKYGAQELAEEIRFGCNWVVGWHVSAVSWRHGPPSGTERSNGLIYPSPPMCGLVSECLQLLVYSLLPPLSLAYQPI